MGTANTHLTMNAFILLACVAASSAQYVAHPHIHGVAGYPYAAAGVPAAYAGYAGAYPYAAPVAAPVPPSSQFQAQDEFGNLNYGYANINSQKHEVGNTYGGVTGSYSYVDANGVVQTANYIADHLGFRVQAPNLPVAPAAPEVELPVAPVHEYTLPVAPVFEGVQEPAPVHVYELPVAPVYDGVAPAPVEDTPEVAKAKAEHLALLAAATAERRRKRRSTPAATEVLAAAAPLPALGYAGLGYAGGLPYAGLGYAGALPHVAGYAGYPYAGLPYAGHGLAYAAPAVAAPLAAAPAAVVASAPAVRKAVKTVIQANPGHAEVYIVN